MTKCHGINRTHVTTFAYRFFPVFRIRSPQHNSYHTHKEKTVEGAKRTIDNHYTDRNHIKIAVSRKWPSGNIRTIKEFSGKGKGEAYGHNRNV